jgi:hypothetical protein
MIFLIAVVLLLAAPVHAQLTANVTATHVIRINTTNAVKVQFPNGLNVRDYVVVLPTGVLPTGVMGQPGSFTTTNWQYLNGQNTAATRPTAPVPSGTLTFALPAGKYQARLYRNGSTTDLVGAPVDITVDLTGIDVMGSQKTVVTRTGNADQIDMVLIDNVSATVAAPIGAVVAINGQASPTVAGVLP